MCDLVVVFDDVIVLFSDKQIAFQEGQVEKAWSRWKRRAVLNSVDQLVGAKRWMLKHPDRLFLDPECTQRFPLPIDPKKATVFLVAIAVGAADACRRELGGTGSLMVSDAPYMQERPFSVSSLYGEEVVQVRISPTVNTQIGRWDHPRAGSRLADVSADTPPRAD